MRRQPGRRPRSGPMGNRFLTPRRFTMAADGSACRKRASGPTRAAQRRKSLSTFFRPRPGCCSNGKLKVLASSRMAEPISRPATFSIFMSPTPATPCEMSAWSTVVAGRFKSAKEIPITDSAWSPAGQSAAPMCVGCPTPPFRSRVPSSMLPSLAKAKN